MTAPKGIPGLERLGLLEKKWPVEVVGSVPPILVACIGAWRLFLDPATAPLGWWSLAAAGWLLLASVVKVLHAGAQDRQTAAKRDHDGLLGALHVLHAAAGHAAGIEPQMLDKRLRATFHRVVPPLERAEEIEQIVPYVGGSCDGAGRRFSVRSGITGKAVREGSVYTASLVNDDQEARRRELKEDWGYTEHDLRTLSLNRLSSMAVPVRDVTRQHTLGVIYLDSDQRDLFSAVDVQNAVVTACGGITKFVNERYGK